MHILIPPFFFFFQVLSSLCHDLLSFDLQWSLFCVASSTYKHDSLLSPFPSFGRFARKNPEKEEKDIDRIREVVEEMPNMREIRERLSKRKSVYKEQK